MIGKHRWFWILLFVLLVLMLAGLAAGWNVVLVRDYWKILEVARHISLRDTEKVLNEAQLSAPWASLIVGTLGFMVALGGTILFFVRLLREMRLNQQQSEFLASVTHALKTPIATLELSGNLLQGGGLTAEEAQRLWDSHNAELGRLKEEVNTLLEAARWSTSPIQLVKTEINIDEWIRGHFTRWTQILGPLGELKQEGALAGISAVLDIKLFTMVIDNLMDNSRKFARGTPTVTLRLHQAGDRWQIKIQDQGWGFDPEDSESIFKRFFRSHSDAPYAIAGTGLGLHLAASACQRMKLKIKAESAGRETGAIFTIEGPISLPKS